MTGRRILAHLLYHVCPAHPQVLVLQRMKCFNMELAVRSSTCTGKEVVAAAKLLLHPALSSASEHLHLLHCPNGIERAPYLPLDAEVCLPARMCAVRLRRATYSS